MPEHTITTDCVWRNWLGGTVDGLPFAAKICDVNSPDGIDNGRVLKLFLYAEDGEQEIAAYERGWSIYPTGKQKSMALFALNYAKQRREQTRNALQIQIANLDRAIKRLEGVADT